MREIIFRGKRVDIAGCSVGNITVIDYSHTTNNGDAMWNCRCACGNVFTISASNFKKSKGVGCVNCKNEALRNNCFRHGFADTRLHVIWQHMIARCYSTASNDYKNYGGRGIYACDEWREYMPFHRWATANGYTDHLTIERIDVNGNYEPQNCRWATKKEQSINKRNSRRFQIGGKLQTLPELCEKYGVDYQLAKGRIKRGMNIETALFTPKQRPFGFKKANPTLLKEVSP